MSLEDENECVLIVGLAKRHYWMSLEEKSEFLIVRSAKRHYAVSPEGKTHFCLSDRWRDILECLSDSKNLLADRSAKRWMCVWLLAKRHC